MFRSMPVLEVFVRVPMVAPPESLSLSPFSAELPSAGWKANAMVGASQPPRRSQHHDQLHSLGLLETALHSAQLVSTTAIRGAASYGAPPVTSAEQGQPGNIMIAGDVVGHRHQIHPQQDVAKVATRAFGTITAEAHAHNIAPNTTIVETATNTFREAPIAGAASRPSRHHFPVLILTAIWMRTPVKPVRSSGEASPRLPKSAKLCPEVVDAFEAIWSLLAAHLITAAQGKTR